MTQSNYLGDTQGEFSVAQFFTDGTYEYVRRFVTAEEAVEATKHYTDSVAVVLGLVERVIITDALDCTVFEWKKGLGITFPLPGSDEPLEAGLNHNPESIE